MPKTGGSIHREIPAWSLLSSALPAKNSPANPISVNLDDAFGVLVSYMMRVPYYVWPVEAGSDPRLPDGGLVGACVIEDFRIREGFRHVRLF